ncbi:MAG: DnaK suppressor protein [Janthinobacterium sp.]|jgi:DnaK suppressor protein
MEPSNLTPHEQLKATLERRQHELQSQLDSDADTATAQASVTTEIEASPEDNASSRTLNEVAAEFNEHKAEQLHLVTHALAKFGDGSYGRCESCSEPIGLSRLYARPEARLCITCQTSIEDQEKRIT